jgi:anti-sigma factor RsiW
MSNDLKDILGNSNKDIDNQQLMDYLSSQLNKANEHEVEKAMADDAFINDAVEGLQQMQDAKNMQAYVEQLNADLQKQIAKNKKRKEKRRLKDSPYTYWAIIILLVLMVICFIAVKKYLDAKKVNPVATSSIAIKATIATPASPQSF